MRSFKEERSSRMKKTVASVVLGVAIVGVATGFFALKAKNRIRPNTKIGPIVVGNMDADKAAQLLSSWWERTRNHEIELKSDLLTDNGAVTGADLALDFDLQATMSQATRASIFDRFRKYEIKRISPVISVKGEKMAALKEELETHLKAPSSAKVEFLAGQIKRQPETGNAEVDVAALQAKVLASMVTRADIEVPFVEGEKRVPDAALASIIEVESEFTTKFPTYKKTRCENIQLASSKLDGLILMPGERVSFNGTVGRRTQQAGFKIAGVFKNGKHDVDIGGGICQVSSTLYNAALLANLKIVERHNHSMPVPYVPVGRDATVDYGSLDLEIENNTGHAIAIDTQYQPGKLTIRVLGQKNKGQDVKIESDGRSSWAVGTQTIVDPKLAPGRRKVIDEGASGQQINTYRVVYNDGRVVAREPLGKSYYRGGQKIIAVGAAPARNTQRAATSDASSGMRLTSSNPN